MHISLKKFNWKELTRTDRTLLMFGAGAAILLLWSAVDLYHDWRIEHNGVPVSARVTASIMDSVEDQRDRSYPIRRVDYAYVAAGSQYTGDFTQDIESSIPATVSVRYDPDSPSRSSLQGESTGQANHWMLFGFSALVLLRVIYPSLREDGFSHA